MAKTSSIGSRMRNKLADITNSKTMRAHMEDDNGVIDQLVKENMALMKLIMERNKIIDLSEAELQNLRASIQKLQLQNWHLAQSNSRFLAEINLGRKRIKSLEHEIECKEALLRAKCLNVKGKAEMNNRNSEWQEGEKPTGQPSLAIVNTDTKSCNGNTKPPGRTRSQSMGPSTSYSTVVDKEKVENKRHCVRRRHSSRFRYQVRDLEEKLFEIEDIKLLASEEEEKETKNNGSSLSSPRTSVGRPFSRAAKEIQSYKESRLNIKIRRQE
ncbi:SHUGOSHIN 2 isoform X2 [Benincasa hispida]|uniref:SHUGOSHIN 2 isoform X2 n=1 Tax=Benincasa hispida TaxID=102211 RepID=UPI0019006DFA|nr:SHUGOSHIN 2 isoform X2 [Benincasa hispida]